MNPPSTPKPAATNIPSDSWPGKQLDAHTHRWLEFSVWTLIYGGLLLLIVGVATGDLSTVWGWSLAAIGTSATAAGVVLIYIRSRHPRS